MKVNYKLKKTELSDQQKERLEKKFARLERFFSPDAELSVKLSEEHSLVRLELTVFDTSTFYRADVKDSSDALTAADAAIDIIEGQLRKYKTKLEKRLRAGAFEPADEPVEEPAEFKITNTKHFLYRPMSPEEAVLQMNLLGHQFYVFKNEDTDRICVVYRRKDNDYGMIEPID